MKPYWNEMTTPRPGLRIQEVETKQDNIYIKDEWGRVWQIVIEVDHPMIYALGLE